MAIQLNSILEIPKTYIYDFLFKKLKPNKPAQTAKNTSLRKLTHKETIILAAISYFGYKAFKKYTYPELKKWYYTKKSKKGKQSKNKQKTNQKSKKENSK